MTHPSNPSVEVDPAYRQLARTLDALPNGFPAAADQSDLRLLAKLFTPQQADLAANLLDELEGPAQIAERLGRDLREVAGLLKEMSRNGLIAMGKTSQGRLGFGLLPFVVGIYEAQVQRMDVELAQLFESYFHAAFGSALKTAPQVHRVIPVGESIRNDMEVRPFESATGLIDQMQSWGVIPCICRTQKALIGEPCQHPIDVCMVLSNSPDAFAGSPDVRALTRDEAVQTLKFAADAGLVHCVSNNQRDLWYICNCCTCSCGILRGMAELGIANVVARSAFVNRVDQDLCIACGACVEACPFEALSLADSAEVLEIRCAGCGLCISVCPQDALQLVRRPQEGLPPETEQDWRTARKAARNLS